MTTIIPQLIDAAFNFLAAHEVAFRWLLIAVMIAAIIVRIWRDRIGARLLVSGLELPATAPKLFWKRETDFLAAPMPIYYPQSYVGEVSPKFIGAPKYCIIATEACNMNRGECSRFWEGSSTYLPPHDIEMRARLKWN